MHPSHCDVAFYDHALLLPAAAAAMADPSDMFVSKLSGCSKTSTYHIYPRARAGRACPLHQAQSNMGQVDETVEITRMSLPAQNSG